MPKKSAAVRRARSLAALGFALGLLVAPAKGAGDAPDASSTLKDALQALTTERQGFTAYHLNLDDQRRSPGKTTVDEQSGQLRNGDRVVAVRIYSHSTNGKAATPDELAKAQADADAKLPSDDWLPVQEDRLSEYKIESAACDQCPAGDVAVRFTSTKRDAAHSDGTAVIDPSAHHIISINYVPNVLPKYVDKANVTITFGRVLPDLWDVTEARQHYQGHMMFVSGGADIETTQTNYHRFASRDEGLKALAAGL